MPPDVKSVGTARHFVGLALTEWGVDPADAVLLTSEIVTNAVLHARTEFTVTARLIDGCVRVEVEDDNPRAPLLATPPLEATTGRGMGVIRALADAWGVDRHDQYGKTVWFEVRPPLTGPTAS